jgi:hypothetical protein
LAQLAPPGTPSADLQTAADRNAIKADVYRAAAELWEIRAISLDTQTADIGPVVASASQDGISVTYVDASVRVQAQAANAWATSRRLLARAKPGNPLTHQTTDTPWLHRAIDDTFDWGISDLWEQDIVIPIVPDVP